MAPELSEEQRKLIEARLGTSKTPKARAEVQPIPHVDREGPPPFSAGQQGLVFDYHRRRDEPVYTVTHSYIAGPLSDGSAAIEALQFARALETVAMAHETLHVSFGPDRRSLPKNEAVLVEVAGSAEAEVDDEAFVALADQRARQRIDIENGPLVRALVVSLTEGRSGVILSLHHVSCDAGSLAVLWKDIAQVYAGESLTSDGATYSDHGEWQRSRVTSDDLAWWHQQLGEHPETGDLGFARPTTPGPNGYITRPVGIDNASLAALGSRPLPVFLAAYGAVLQHLANVDEPTVGVALSTRDHPSTESMVGYFLTVLPFRLPVGSSTFRELVSAAETRLTEALLRRHVPYGEILRTMPTELAPGTDLLTNMFVFDEAHDPQINGQALTGRIHANGSSVSGITLFVRAGADGSGWEAALEYRGDQLDDEAAELFLALYCDAVVALLSAPDTEVRSRHLAGHGELSDLEGERITASLQALPEIIADVAEAGPEAPAVRCGNESITYGEMIDRADALASRLRALGVQTGDRVAVLAPRSVDLVIALVGTLRAGAAYVPIDPEYPAERIELILAEAKPTAMVAAADMPSISTDCVVASVPGAVEHPVPAKPEWRPELGDPAYVIFTSGSTGVPRGVEVTHQNLAASTLARFDVYEEQPERFLLLSSYGFDSSIVGLFWTLAAGGEIVLPTDEQVHDVDLIAGLIGRHEITHLLTVPSLYDAVLRRSPGSLRSLLVAIVAGEAATTSVVDRHLTMLPNCELVNEYGPTETTVWATSQTCVVVPPEDSSVPIGLPVPGTIVRVADRFGRPLPSGVAGELWVGGLGLTSGYINDEKATAEKFVREPVGGGAMYRTGDRTRLTSDGVLEFLGRVDNQLNVGGQRFEPEEIESLITADSRVGAAVVVFGESGRLVALVEATAEAGNSSLVNDITEALRVRVPTALVPRDIVVVERLPRSVHGKVDRHAAIELMPEHRDEDVAEEGTLGMVIAIWRDVLGTAAIDASSDFFDVGGDSLRALQLCEQVEESFGLRLGIGELIGARTPMALAELLVDQPEIEDVTLHLFEVLRRAPEGSRQNTLVLLPPGGGNLLAYEALVQRLDPNQQVVGFRLPGADGRSQPVHTIGEQADHILPELLAAVPSTSGFQLVGWSTGGLLGLELADRLQRRGHTIELLAMIDTIFPGHQRTAQPTKLGKYRSLYQEGGGKSVLTHAKLRLKIRRREGADRVRARVAESIGATDNATANEQRLFEIAFGAAESFRPPEYDGPVMFYAASATDGSRTIAPWSDHLPDFEVMVVEGEHSEENALLDAERVGPLAEHLQKLLDGPSR